MKRAALLSHERPWFYTLTLEVGVAPAWLTSLQRDSEPGFVLRILDCKEMATVEALLSTFAEVFEFPEYFGGNFNALRDCLEDLAWLPGTAYTVGLLNAPLLLAREDTAAAMDFLNLLATVCEYWNSPIQLGESWDRDAVPFHVILHTVPSQRSALDQLVTRAEVITSPIDSN